jgi:molybdopterin converting factor subunit 1
MRQSTVKRPKLSNFLESMKISNSSLAPPLCPDPVVLQSAATRADRYPLLLKLPQIRTGLLAPPGYAGYNSSVPPASQTIRVKVLFFGRLKDLTGYAEESAEFADATSIEQLFALYSSRHPELVKYRSSVVASCNEEFAPWDTLLRSGDEVAFLPPVSGG